MQKACRPSPMHSAASAAVLHALLQRDGRAQGVGPLGVFKGDGLDALDDLVGVNALGVVAKPVSLFKILEAVLLQGTARSAAFFFRNLQT